MGLLGCHKIKQYVSSLNCFPFKFQNNFTCNKHINCRGIFSHLILRGGKAWKVEKEKKVYLYLKMDSQETSYDFYRTIESP